jgi:heme-degrading monooxygenase HmoA
MITVITHMTLQEGSEAEWDAAMRERLVNARRRPGWVGGQILMPLETLHQRVIVGTWQTRADWEAWHADPAFAAMRGRLDAAQAETAEPSWYEVVADVSARSWPEAVQTLIARGREQVTRLTRRKTASS